MSLSEDETGVELIIIIIIKCSHGEVEGLDGEVGVIPPVPPAIQAL